MIFVAPPDREARLESRAPIVAALPTRLASIHGVDNVLVRLQNSLDQVEGRQLAALNAYQDGMESRVRRMRGVISDLGLDMAELEAAGPRAPMGGPFVPVKLPADATPFDRQLYRITLVGQPLVGVDGKPSRSIEGLPILSAAEELRMMAAE